MKKETITQLKPHFGLSILILSVVLVAGLYIADSYCKSSIVIYQTAPLEPKVRRMCEAAKIRSSMALQRLQTWGEGEYDAKEEIIEKQGIAQALELGEWMELCGLVGARDKMLIALQRPQGEDVPAMRELLYEFTTFHAR